jgi:uncharacterized RDD family membrane protein YckC
MNLLLLAQAIPDPSMRAAGAGLAGFGIVMLVLAILASIFWIWMLVDCATNRSLEGAQKIVWILVILFLHLLGALIYFFVGRGSRSALV